MSAFKETLVFCDGRDEGITDCPKDGPYGDGDSRMLSAKRQRQTYVKDGWRYVGGKDYCPHCVKVRASSTDTNNQ